MNTIVIPELNPELTVINGEIKTTSLKIAEHFHKRHDDVLKKIQNLDCSPEFNVRNFAVVEYIDAKGEKRPAYEITRDGFTFLAMGFTGAKAAQWKEAYIIAFNRMESELQGKAAKTTPAQIKSLMAEGYVVSPADQLIRKFAEFLTFNKCPDNMDNLPAPSPLLTRAELEAFVEELKVKSVTGELLPKLQPHGLTINLTPLDSEGQVRRWLVTQLYDQGLIMHSIGDDKELMTLAEAAGKLRDKGCIVAERDDLQKALRRACGETITVRRNTEMVVKISAEIYQDSEQKFFEALKG